MNKRISLFLFAFVECMLVAVQTVWIIQRWYLGVFLNNIVICVVWMANIRKMTTDIDRDQYRTSYTLGCSMGATFGVWLADTILEWVAR